MEKEVLIEMAQVTRTHGVKGAVQVRLYNLDTNLFKKGFKVFLGDENEQEEFVLDACSLGSKTIMTFVGIDSMDAAETLIGKSLFLPRSAFADAEDDEFYLTDLEGLKVFNHENGEEVGVVGRFYDTGAQIVFEIVKGNEVMFELPFVAPFFPVVDIEENRVEIVIPSYLE